MVAKAEERVMPDQVAGRWRRAAFFLALPSFVVFIGIGFVPFALVATWSLWSFDPDTYWIKPVWSLERPPARDAARRAVHHSVLHQWPGSSVCLAPRAWPRGHHQQRAHKAWSRAHARRVA